jgi:hypothetical protein
MKHEYLIVDNSPTYNYELKGTNHIWLRGGVNVRQNIADSQNKIREHFLKGDYTHLAFLESDLLPPTNVFDRLALHNLDVVGHPYFLFEGSNREYMITEPLLIGSRVNAINTSIEKGFHYASGNLRRVISVGFGCVLIKRHVIEKIKFHINESSRMIDTNKKSPSSSDSFFYGDCLLNGIEVYADTSKTIKHYNKDWSKNLC